MYGEKSVDESKSETGGESKSEAGGESKSETGGESKSEPGGVEGGEGGYSRGYSQSIQKSISQSIQIQKGKNECHTKNEIKNRNGKNGHKNKVIRGKLERLEPYLNENWWKEIFDELYLKTDGDIVEEEEITRKEVDFFLSILNPEKDEPILDLCCGQGRHSIELAKRGFKVAGLDSSRYLINKARERTKNLNLDIDFKVGDARYLPYPENFFKYVLILGNSFGYFLNEEDNIRIIKEAFRVLKPYGILLLDITDGEYMKEKFERRSWEWIDKEIFVCREREITSDGKRIISREIISHIKKGVIADRIYAERLYTKSEIKEILSPYFIDINFWSIESESSRNEDLGMMKRRIVISCFAKKEIKRRKNKKDVVVALIDTKFPHPLRGEDYDELFSICKLKGVLSEIDEYNFIYLEDHNTFFKDILSLKDKIDFVFNLCDEGLFGDPRKELHIPALMEILGIPYTGSPPHTLAVCFDKSLIRGVAREMGIPIPKGVFVENEKDLEDIQIEPPVIIKPVFGDSSYGVTKKSVVYEKDILVDVMREIRGKFNYFGPFLVEEFLEENDLTFGVIGNPPNLIILPITEEDYSNLQPELPRICGWEAKWDINSPYFKIKTIPARIPDEAKSFIVNSSLRLFKRLDMRDYARFDWRIGKDGTPYLLEVNPNPGWSFDGHLAKACRLYGMTYKDMLFEILKSAESRFEKFERSKRIKK